MTSTPQPFAAVVRAARRSALVERLRAALWFTPSLFVAGSAAAAALLVRVDVGRSSILAHLVFPGGADSARASLQAIAGSVITVTGVVFSLTVVTLQLASTQFSPRLLRTFLRDLSNQIVLGTFLATFSYALLVLRAVKSGTGAEDDVVPALAVTGAYVLVAASVIALVYFIDHIARAIRIDSLMREVNEDTTEVIEDRFGGADSSAPLETRSEVPESATIVVAPRSGFVQAIDERRLLELAEASRLVIRLEPSVGERVVEGGPLAGIWHEGGEQSRTAPSECAARVAGAFQIGYERTMQNDIAFGFRQLVDIAVKALSPGVNDPTTAVHAIGHIAALLVELSRRPVGSRVWIGSDGVGRVEVRDTDFAGYLDLACGQIRRYGAAEPAVTTELLRMLADVARGRLGPEWVEAVEREASMIVAAATRETSERRDLEEVHHLELELRRLLEKTG